MIGRITVAKLERKFVSSIIKLNRFSGMLEGLFSNYNLNKLLNANKMNGLYSSFHKNIISKIQLNRMF